MDILPDVRVHLGITIVPRLVQSHPAHSIRAAFPGAGTHSVTWNAVKHSAGVYFCTVKFGKYSRTVKMTLLK